MRKIVFFPFLLLFAHTVLSAQTILQQFAAVSAGAGEVADMDLPQPTTKGSLILAMPESLTPDIKVVQVTDNAEDGGNTYKQVPSSTSLCLGRYVEIWYCENCKGGVTELKFHLSGHEQGGIHAFMEITDIASPSLEGNGVQLSDATADKNGREVGPSIKISGHDFVIARYSSKPRPTAVTPNLWTYKPTYVYGLSLPAGTYQPVLSGENTAGANFCMSVAAFRVASASMTQK